MINWPKDILTPNNKGSINGTQYFLYFLCSYRDDNWDFRRENMKKNLAFAYHDVMKKHKKYSPVDTPYIRHIIG